MRLLLGRQPSERAYVELSQRPLGASADLVLLGAEFEGVARRGLIERTPMPHHRSPFNPTPPELRWLAELLGMSEEGTEELGRTRDWLGLVAVVLRDPALAVRLAADWREHGRLPALQVLIQDVAAAYPNIEAAAALTLPRILPPPTPPLPREGTRRTDPKLSGPSAIAGAMRSKASTPPSRSPAAKPAEDPPRSPRMTGPALDPASGQALWLSVLADPSSPKLRGELYNAFRNNQNLILFVNARLDEVPKGRCAPYESLIRLLAARVLLRLFLARSAWQMAHAALLADMASPGALRANDQNRLLKTLATAALRTGRVEEATGILERLVRDDPLDWEAYMALADVLGGTDPMRAADLYALAMHLHPGLSAAGRLAVAEFLYLNGDSVGARKVVLDTMRADMALPECHLALGNMALSEDDRDTWAVRARAFFELQGLSVPRFDLADPADHLFGIGLSGLARRDDHPLVTVVTTAWNASATLAGSMRSVLDQTYGNLELLVVDDRSTDGTVGIVDEFAQRDPRVRLLRSAVNIGTYCAKNRAIREARGAFVTMHDSDDWMHPQRIELHLEAIARGEQAASMSNWVRMEGDGRAVLRKGGGGYIHRNPASTFIRREVFERVGLFDSVRVGADSEMLWRIRHAFGLDSILNIDTSLGLGLHHENSLTQSGVTAFDEFRFSPVRLDYAEAWGAWHIRSLNLGVPLFMDFPLIARPFAVPAEIEVKETQAELTCPDTVT